MGEPLANLANLQAAIHARHARRLHAKVNLILRGGPARAATRPYRTRRLEKGHDIAAACGQLRLKQETGEGIQSA